ncbi:hypothetical protein BC938DRAFT_482940 [Jimgerdemannia flammicorona]|uniref:Calponin-homology (CH) domain-containing protein n=1 Tax=Jimgerdemannia flammicorona TaxID=994334 RepID=A0A433QW84_9FUNG|nr:hypothetical protein BC938DRAFT_482940 [Jimgerdemannia flammicorona]
MDSKENDSALLRDLKVINDLPDPPRTTRPKRAITQSRRTLSELPSVLQAAANSRVTRNSDFGAPARPNLPFSRAPVSRGKLALKRPLPAETDELDFDLELAPAPAPAPAPHRLKTSHRPLQYISRNDMYDNAWIDKQENAFTKWLNYELGAEDDLGAEGFGSMWASPPAKAAVEAKADPVSLDYYTQKLQYERIRAMACTLYQSETFSVVLRKVDDAIARNRLKLHPDVNMVEDVGVRQGIVDLLFTYDPRWLVVGLETVIGRAVAPLLTTDQGKISAFMNRNLFHDDAIAATFRPTGNKSTRRPFLLAMHRSIFLRVLMTIFFLDRAKPARLLPNDPCLFRRSAPHKTSRDMVVAIAAKYLLGEGDVVRHLFYIGYAVNHVQTPLEEYNFEVKNLATDLRDGIKLTRLVERYTCEWGLSLQLRHPAQSRAQQLHNVSLALGVVQRHGVDLDAGPRAGTIAAKDVVDGHREKTFALLWSVIMHWRIPAVLDKRALRFEIRLLGEEFERKFRRKVDAESDTMYITSEHLTLLLSWCKVVCAFYGVPVRNFTNSFADGRALCYIVHHYHPSVLPADRIENSGRYLETMLKEAEEIAPPEGTMSWFIPSENIKDPVVEGRELDKKNFRLLHAKVKELGGVPLILRYQDFSTLGVPDEKVVITYVTYLCARVIHLSREIRAARRIQLTWRTHHQRRLLAERCRTIISIQACVRRFIVRQTLRRYFLVRVDAAIKIQSTYRGYLGRLVAAQRYSATVWLQTMARRALARRRFVAEKGVRAIQAQCRGVVVRKRIETLLDMVRPMQAAARGWLVRQRVGRDMIAHRAATMIQTAWRGVEARQWFLLLKAVVLVLEERRQATLLCRRDRERYEKLWWATCTVQQQWRAKLEGTRVRKWYAGVRKVVIKTQTVARGVLVRRRYREIRAAVAMQKVWRGFQARRDYVLLRAATIAMQRRRRALLETRRERQGFLIQKWAVMVIQERWRACILARRTARAYMLWRFAAVFIQRNWRRYVARRRFVELKAVTLAMQRRRRALVATRAERKEFIVQKWAAMVIQERWRAYVVTRQTADAFQAYRCAAIVVQAAWRRYEARTRFLELREAVGYVQRRRRALVATRAERKEFIMQKWAAMVIQERWRAYVVTRQTADAFQTYRCAAIVMQAAWRRYEARTRFLELREAAVCVQRRRRALVTTKAEREEFMIQKWAAMVIQERWRAYVVARQTAKAFQVYRCAAVVAQTAWRRYEARTRFLELREAAVCVQRRRRAIVMTRLVREWYIDLVWATMVFQQRWRAQLAMREAAESYQAMRKAAVVLQSVYRGYRARCEVEQLRVETHAATVIQTAYRTFVARYDFVMLKAAAICVQRRRRALVQGREVHAAYHEYRDAALQIQEWWRACQLRRTIRADFVALRSAIIGVQSLVRGGMVRELVRRFRAAVKIQSVYRMYVCRREFEDMRWAAWVVQARWRAKVACVEERRWYLQKCWASTIIQETWRACQERRRCRNEFLDMRWASITIQSHFKRYLARTQFLQMREAAVTIQRVVRGHLARVVLAQQYDEEYCAATVIQAGARGYLTRVRIAREMALRREYLQSWFQEAYQHMCAIRIQRVFRNHVAYQAAKKHHDSIVTIQQWWRAKAVRLNFLRLRAATLFVQARAKLVFLRHTRAALIIQKRWQVVVARRRFLRICEATLLIQSVWRAHLVRRTQGPKFRAMRRNIREVNARAEEHMKLSNRTTMALDILLTSKQLSAVLKACYHLDVVTDLSKICCLRLIEHDVIRIIFTLIKQSNRSQPHMEVLKHAMYILRNLSRTPETSPHVFADPEGVDILVESLQSYRENERIFACAASILVTMARGGQDGTANARQMRQLPNVLKRIKAVQAFAERKFAKEFSATGTAAKASKAAAKPMTKVAKEKEREKERANRTLAALTELMERLEGRK